MANGSFRLIDETYSKYVFQISYPDGRTEVISGRNRKELAEECRKRLKAINAYNIGRPKGTKNNAYSYVNVEQFKKLLGNFSLAVQVGAAAGYTEMAEKLAEELMIKTRALANRKPNVYSGHLERSYVTTVINNGRVVFQKYPKQETVHFDRGPEGGRMIKLREENHPVAAFIYKSRKRHDRYKKPRYLKNAMGEIIRYAKKWEKQSGYITNKAFSPSFRPASKIGLNGGYRAGYITGEKKGGLARGAIVIENVAPYAAAVNSSYGKVQTARNGDSGDVRRYRGASYSIMKNAVPRAQKNGYGLIQIATKRLLREAGFDKI